MFDYFGNEITDADLPHGIDPVEMDETLKDFGYTFHSLYEGDSTKFKVASLTYTPPTFRDMSFDELKGLIEKCRLMPDVNEPRIRQLIERSAQAAVRVLREELPAVETGINEKFESELVAELTAMLRQRPRGISFVRLDKVLKNWPSKV
jgi:hypothetical protein